MGEGVVVIISTDCGAASFNAIMILGSTPQKTDFMMDERISWSKIIRKTIFLQNWQIATNLLRRQHTQS